jgi:hypothetical protein
MVPKENDGQAPGQSADGGEGGTTTEGGQESRGDTAKIEDLEARLELMTENFADLRNAILQNGKQSPAPSADIQVELDDGEPLTASKVNKIIQHNLDAAVRSGNAKQERTQWDLKAGQEFPLQDPKFLREFNREWKEQVAGGLNPNHPRALYNVAKIVARTSGVVKKEPRQRDPEADPTQTSESSSSSRRPERAGGAKAVSDDDPRVALYRMGTPSKEKVEAFKKKLGEQDARKGRSAR